MISFFLLFCVCTCYSLIRNIKDTVILTTNGPDAAEVIPFLKVWGMLPGVFVAMWIYSKLANRLHRDHLFYLIISSFLAYFLLFAFVIFPHHESLQLISLKAFLTDFLPNGFKGLVLMICNWHLSMFYVISELWSSIVLSILFWGFMNNVTLREEAKRFYGFLNIGSNIAPFLGVPLCQFIIHSITWEFHGLITDPWGNTLARSMLIICILGMAAMLLYRELSLKYYREPSSDHDLPASGKPKKEKLKLSVWSSIKHIAGDRYLMCLAVIVIGYNITINFSDVMWKYQLKRYLTNPEDMLTHMNFVSMTIGGIATLLAIGFSVLVSYFGWKRTALITPMVMMIFAVLFFSSIFLSSSLEALTVPLLGLSPLALSVYLGSAQNSLSKASKYSVFDASKELAFLSFSPEDKIKGKAAIDGLGSGIGKSGSSLIYQLLLIGLGSIALCTPYIAVLLAVVLTLWLAAISLGAKRFDRDDLQA